MLEQEVVGPQRAFLAAGEDRDDARGRGGAQQREQVGHEAHACVVADGGDSVEAFGRGVAGREGEVPRREVEDVDSGGRGRVVCDQFARFVDAGEEGEVVGLDGVEVGGRVEAFKVVDDGREGGRGAADDEDGGRVGVSGQGFEGAEADALGRTHEDGRHARAGSFEGFVIVEDVGVGDHVGGSLGLDGRVVRP